MALIVSKNRLVSPAPSPIGSGSIPVSPQPSSPLAERVSASFEQLADSAIELNQVSDDLGQPITAIEAALKRLNLGISTWVEFAGETDHGTGDFWSRDLGYAKFAGKWGIAIRAMNGNLADDDPNEETWPFNEAPRVHRLDAVDKLPDLLEQLVVAAKQTAEKLKQKIEGARQVAFTVAQVTNARAKK